MIKTLQKKYIRYLIARKIVRSDKSDPRMSLARAKNIGIVTAIEDIESFNSIIQLKKELERQNKKVSVLCFYPFKAAPAFYKTQMQAEVFSTRDLNLMGVPKSVFSKDFLNSKYDILIDFSLTTFIPLQYIVAFSDASLKAGRYCKEMVPVYDFLVKKPEDAGTGKFINILMSYLSKINTTQNEA